MKKLIVITAFALLGLLASSVQAELLTGCVTDKGKLKNVAIGEEPTRECGRKDTLIQWEKAEPASICPCDFDAPALWAGWIGPHCVMDFWQGGPGTLLSLNQGGLKPTVGVIDDVGLYSCFTQPYNSAFTQIPINSLDELDVCYADLNELAIILGLLDGCEVP